jgi:predicted enzyme related to lactoylglutathione lyase
MSPAVANGKVRYLEIPAVDFERSADFYRDVFRWVIRRRGEGALAFDNATGRGERQLRHRPGRRCQMLVSSST